MYMGSFRWCWRLPPYTKRTASLQSFECFDTLVLGDPRLRGDDNLKKVAEPAEAQQRLAMTSAKKNRMDSLPRSARVGLYFSGRLTSLRSQPAY